MWAPAVYYADHAEYEGYEEAGEYEEGYDEEGVEEEYDDASWTAPLMTAPRCWNGSSCPFLATGTCQYYHPPADLEELEPEPEAPEAPEPPAPPAPKPRNALDVKPRKSTPSHAVMVAQRPCATPWNILVNAASTGPDSPKAAPEKETPEAKMLKARLTARADLEESETKRHRSRSPRSSAKADARTRAKECLLDKARTLLAELRGKVEVTKQSPRTAASGSVSLTAAAMKGA